MRGIFSFQKFVILLGSVAVLVVHIGMAHAQDVSDQHLEAAKRVIDAIHATDQFDNFLPMVARDLKNELTGDDPNLAADIAEIVDKQVLAFTKRRSGLEKEVARVYAEHFSQTELETITIFYSSDVGKKFLKEVPSVARDVYSVFDVWKSAVMQDLMKNIEKEMSKTLKLNKSATPIPSGSRAYSK
ncbi:DUF2059 domain-containing protein [Bartonella sp. A05]|uniref:DUF2059 domain-containing protein n=1 Tax=Bartonella sp. A05 TaxID=2967261 RepID=UPI0022A9E707|nr:DUF2059 domain-containing protein [Bartonella sp. A05]MCZ2204185.1 DUF2059 domain-containing protein [Bartonella sp. A05]